MRLYVSGPSALQTVPQTLPLKHAYTQLPFSSRTCLAHHEHCVRDELAPRYIAHTSHRSIGYAAPTGIWIRKDSYPAYGCTVGETHALMVSDSLIGTTEKHKSPAKTALTEVITVLEEPFQIAEIFKKSLKKVNL